MADTTLDPHDLAVSPAAFRAQMEYLSQTCRVVPLTTLVQGGAPMSRSVAVTFDDGYVDNFSEASPILTRLGIPATFFVTTDGLDGDYHFWWDVVARALLTDSPNRPRLLTLDCDGQTTTWPTATPPECVATHKLVWERLFRMPVEPRTSALLQLERWAGRIVTRDPRNRRMRSEEILSLSRRPGHDIGAHSVHHIPLAGQPADIQRAEIAGSGTALEELISKRVTAFSYPFGQHDAASLTVVRESFNLAVTVDAQCLTSATDPLCVPRFVVTPERSATFVDWIDDVFDGAVRTH